MTRFRLARAVAALAAATALGTSLTACELVSGRPDPPHAPGAFGLVVNRPGPEVRLGPLLRDPAVELVKGAYEPAGRDGLGELVARPLLNLHLPDLAGFVDPLGFELAARRTMLERLPFPVGDGVEIALLIDAYRTAGLDGLAQADLGERPPAVRHDAAKALAVIAAVERRIHGAARSEADAPGPLLQPFADGFEPRSVALDERPPLLELLPAAVGAQSLRPV